MNNHVWARFGRLRCPLVRAALAGWVVGCAASPVPAPVPVREPRNSTPTATARWVFFEPGFAANVRLELGTSGTLYGGALGRRALVTAEGKIVHSSIPLPAPIIAAHTNVDGSVTFLTPPLGVYRSTEPLGPYQMVHAPDDPEHYGQVFAAAGRRALVVITKDKAVRSNDGGATWSKMALPGAPFTIEKLQLDALGHGAVSYIPRWQLATDDDGATWRDVPGGSQWSATEPQYEVLSDTVRPLPNGAHHQTQFPAANYYVDSTLVVEPQGKDRGMLGVGWFGSSLDSTAKVFSRHCLYTKVDGRDGDITVACLTGGYGTEIAHFDGKSWAAEGSSGSEFESLLTGPDGWTLLYTAYGGSLVRIRRGTDFVPMKPKLNIVAAAVDVGRRKVFALVAPSVKGQREIWTGGLEQPELTPWVALDSWFDDKFCKLALADDGGVDIYVRDDTPVIAHYGVDGKLAKRFAPALKTLYAVTAGRAIGASADCTLKESADGGRSWSPVPGPATPLEHCSQRGCQTSTAARIGWQLAKGARGTELASEQWPQKRERAHKPSVASPERLVYACTPEGPAQRVNPDQPPDGNDPGAFAPLLAFSAGVGLAGDTRFAYFETARDGSVKVTFASGSAAPRSLPLLGPEPKHVRAITDTKYETDGLVAVRYSRGAVAYDEDVPTAGSASIEVAWFDARVASVFHGRIAAVAFAQLPLYSNDGGLPPRQTTAIGDSGLFLRPRGTKGAWFIRTSGKVEPISWPAPDANSVNVTGQYVASAGDEVTLFEAEPSHIRVSRARSPFEQWSSVRWLWGSSTSYVSVLHGVTSSTLLDGHWLFPVDANSPDPSHSPVKIHPTSASNRFEACTAKQLEGLSVRIDDDKGEMERAPIIRLPEDELTTSNAGLRVSADGSACVSSILAYSGVNQNQAVLLAPHDSERAWMVAPEYEHFTISIRRAKCQKIE